jgi:hypothetical protein
MLNHFLVAIVLSYFSIATMLSHYSCYSAQSFSTIKGAQPFLGATVLGHSSFAKVFSHSSFAKVFSHSSLLHYAGLNYKNDAWVEITLIDVVLLISDRSHARCKFLRVEIPEATSRQGILVIHEHPPTGQPDGDVSEGPLDLVSNIGAHGTTGEDHC